MRVLFVHQNFPGQYLHLAPALAAREHEVVGLGMRNPPVALPGVRSYAYPVKRAAIDGQHPLLRDLEAKMLRAEAATQACLQLERQGWRPDLICVHPGWGEAMFLRALWPAAKQLHYVEYHYAPEGQDVGFDPEAPPVDLALRCKLSVKNLVLLQSLEQMDRGVSPTRWQASTVPAVWQDKLRVVHDGIDTRRAAPKAGARFVARSQAGRTLDLGQDDEVLSFVSRNLEPSRGYHRFVRALPAILNRRPAAQVVVVGGDGSGYGAAPVSGSHQQNYWDEVHPQLSVDQQARVHFVGRVPHASLMALFQVTRAHVYLSYPFVLSWSMLEAMACGAVVIGSDTAPVREVIQPGVTGHLVGFFDQAALVESVCAALPHRPGTLAMAGAARAQMREGYDLATRCLPRQVALAESFADL